MNEIKMYKAHDTVKKKRGGELRKKVEVEVGVEDMEAAKVLYPAHRTLLDALLDRHWPPCYA